MSASPSNAAPRNDTLQRAIFFLALAYCLTALVPKASPFAAEWRVMLDKFTASPPIALFLGLIVAFTIGHPFAKQNAKFTKMLLQCSVVGLGFGINLQTVLRAGGEGLWFTAISIVCVLVLGFLIGKWLKMNAETSHLISSGTAICGGSAIAAVGKVLNADAKEMSVSLGTVFILNSIALFIFPPIGHALHLNQHQFGMWSAIAIHDTSSVVGAAKAYDPYFRSEIDNKWQNDLTAAAGDTEKIKAASEKHDAAITATSDIATSVKLARTLWIIPLALLTAFMFRRSRVVEGERPREPMGLDSQMARGDARPPKTKTAITIPWFILYFLIASVITTLLPAGKDVFLQLKAVAVAGLTVTLFLIGAGLSRDTLKSVGIKPLLQGVILWLFISVVSLWVTKSWL